DRQRVLLQSISISGPDSVNENSSASYTATAFYTNGTSRQVTPSWQSNSAIASIGTTGQLNAGAIGSNTAIEVSATYLEGSISRTASKAVTIVDVPVLAP